MIEIRIYETIDREFTYLNKGFSTTIESTEIILYPSYYHDEKTDRIDMTRFDISYDDEFIEFEKDKITKVRI